MARRLFVRPFAAHAGWLDVRGLEVAVHDAVLVRLLQRLGDLLRDPERFVALSKP